MISNEELVGKIIRFRVKNNMTQEEFAKSVGISYSTINLLENLKNNPTKTTKTKLLMFMEDYENNLRKDNKE